MTRICTRCNTTYGCEIVRCPRCHNPEFSVDRQDLSEAERVWLEKQEGRRCS